MSDKPTINVQDNPQKPVVVKINLERIVRFYSDTHAEQYILGKLKDACAPVIGVFYKELRSGTLEWRDNSNEMSRTYIWTPDAKVAV
jgi:hypothetical protein